MYKRQIQIIILKYSFLKGFVHSNYMTFNQAVCLLPPFFSSLCSCALVAIVQTLHAHTVVLRSQCPVITFDIIWNSIHRLVFRHTDSLLKLLQCLQFRSHRQFDLLCVP